MKTKKIIFYVLTFFIITGFVTSNYWIPRVYLYGTSTYWADSTNYQVTNKSVYIRDSLKVAKDLYVGVNGGNLYMDTSRKISVQTDGLDVVFYDTKQNASEKHYIGYGIGKYQWFRYYNSSGFSHTVMELDSATGLLLYTGNIQLYGGTQQIKIPSDTASDYDANDAITLNRQSGTLTTKSLTTTSDNFYTLTFTNSLITTTTKVYMVYSGGTESAGRPTVYRVTPGSGSATVILLNLTGASSFNGNVKLNFILFN